MSRFTSESTPTTTTTQTHQLAVQCTPPDELLEQFARMAPAGFTPLRALRLNPFAVELEYRHADGRTHVLGLSRVSGLVYRSETIPAAAAVVAQ